MEAPLDTFRSSTLGWLRGTLAGWGTILLALGAIAATLTGYGTYWLGLAAVSLLIILVVLLVAYFVWRHYRNQGERQGNPEARPD